ncbi:MAG: DUF4251 domain-containing protein [Bacteroides sp.]|nr:DUF4251 domain-containing protein [Bacteroides sp.]
MKTIHFTFCLCVALLSVGCATSSRSNSTTAQEVQQQIGSGDYRIDVNMASPRRTRNIPLTSSYWVEVRNDSVFSNLPYYGRAYAVPYGGGQGLQFNAPIEGYEVSHTGKGNTRVSFRAKTPEDTYQYSMTIYTNGNASIQVLMQQRESIGFSGELRTWK